MSSFRQRLTAATDTRLAVVIKAAANLKAQLCELNGLRERVRKELLSARESPQATHQNDPAFGPHTRRERNGSHFW